MPIKSENFTREFGDKTLFSHSDSQLCAAWVPLVKGMNAWSGNQGQVTYKVTDLNMSIQGAASTRKKRMLYTCTRLGCTIECPCNICTESCSKCNTQCDRHEIKVTYKFDVTTDLYTIITEELNMDKYLLCVWLCRHSLELQSLFQGCYAAPNLPSGLSSTMQILFL